MHLLSRVSKNASDYAARFFSSAKQTMKLCAVHHSRHYYFFQFPGSCISWLLHFFFFFFGPMKNVLGVSYCSSFHFASLNNPLSANSTPFEHEAHLRAIFTQLEEYGYIINKKKIVFGMHTTKFLRHFVTPHSARQTFRHENEGDPRLRSAH